MAWAPQGARTDPQNGARGRGHASAPGPMDLPSRHEEKPVGLDRLRVRAHRAWSLIRTDDLFGRREGASCVRRAVGQTSHSVIAGSHRERALTLKRPRSRSALNAWPPQGAATHPGGENRCHEHARSLRGPCPRVRHALRRTQAAVNATAWIPTFAPALSSPSAARLRLGWASRNAGRRGLRGILSFTEVDYMTRERKRRNHSFFLALLYTIDKAA